jgi:hypothetical protein
LKIDEILDSNNLDWYTYFLNQSNHQEGIPLDFISFHFYASCHDRTNVTQYNTFFEQADNFIQTVVEPVIVIRDKLSPSTKIDMDELGKQFLWLGNTDMLRRHSATR